MSEQAMERAVFLAAMKWWRWHRPEGWSEQEHIKNPMVNLGFYSSVPADLARACSDMAATHLPRQHAKGCKHQPDHGGTCSGSKGKGKAGSR